MLNYISNFVDLFWNYLLHTGFLVFRNELRSSSTISSPCSISDDRCANLCNQVINKENGVVFSCRNVYIMIGIKYLLTYQLNKMR